jgi:hypothetical protein
MKVIQPNCRIQFTSEDIDFIISTLGQTRNNRDCLIQLLTDLETRDAILDDEALYHALLEGSGCLRVSSHFYFYVLVRRVFLRIGIGERRVADYVAEMLAEFTLTERQRCVLPGDTRSLDYFFELIGALQRTDEFTRFYLRTHIANYALFLSGVFAARIQSRAERRGFPGLRYYEELGQANFRVASDHRLAQRYDLTAIFTTLGEHFHATRLALNDLTERLLFLGEPEVAPVRIFTPPDKKG